MHEVLIDITRVLGRSFKGRLPTGVDRVCLAYVRHYRLRARAVFRVGGSSFVLPQRESLDLFDWLLGPKGRSRLVAILLRGLLKRRGSQQTAGKFLFNVGHSGLESADYLDSLYRMQVHPILFVHDLIPITHPEFCRAGERDRHITRMNHTLAISKGCVTNSQATLDELAVYAGKRGSVLPSSIVAPLAPGILVKPPGEKIGITPYFVILGTIEPRKNHWMLLQIWRGLVERFGLNAPRLLVIGQRGWECENVIDMLERCDQLRGMVVERSDCTDEELAVYLSHAQALLFPSFAEGYGMPLVEAMAQGVPVIASDLPAFREIAGDIPEYVDPLDGKRWSELIMDYSESGSPSRAAQLRRLDGFEAPTWVNHFVQVDSLLNQLSGVVQHA